MHFDVLLLMVAVSERMKKKNVKGLHFLISNNFYPYAFLFVRFHNVNVRISITKSYVTIAIIN